MAVYLDNSATTAVLPQAAEAAFRAMREGYGNPSSLHEMGRSAKKMLEGARAALALAFGCEEGCVYFTSGGSESINTAIMGAAFKNKHRGRHILSTAIEHDAVLNSLNELKNQGYEVNTGKYIAVRPPGRERFVRLKTLGDDYTEEAIRRRIRDHERTPRYHRPPTLPKNP